jgi:hypothetical protein
MNPSGLMRDRWSIGVKERESVTTEGGLWRSGGLDGAIVAGTGRGGGGGHSGVRRGGEHGRARASHGE